MKNANQIIMKENILKTKSYDFSLKIILLYKEMVARKKEYVLSKQLLKSGTSIGANIEEADRAQSKKDFIAKLQISLKESGETQYWLRLLRDSGFIEKSVAKALIEECMDLSNILTAVLKTAKTNLERSKDA
jgi:four helix bundle protein